MLLQKPNLDFVQWALNRKEKHRRCGGKSVNFDCSSLRGRERESMSEKKTTHSLEGMSDTHTNIRFQSATGIQYNSCGAIAATRCFPTRIENRIRARCWMRWVAGCRATSRHTLVSFAAAPWFQRHTPTLRYFVFAFVGLLALCICAGDFCRTPLPRNGRQRFGKGVSTDGGQ